MIRTVTSKKLFMHYAAYLLICHLELSFSFLKILKFVTVTMFLYIYETYRLQFRGKLFTNVLTNEGSFKWLLFWKVFLLVRSPSNNMTFWNNFQKQRDMILHSKFIVIMSVEILKDNCAKTTTCYRPLVCSFVRPFHSSFLLSFVHLFVRS